MRAGLLGGAGLSPFPVGTRPIGCRAAGWGSVRAPVPARRWALRGGQPSHAGSGLGTAQPSLSGAGGTLGPTPSSQPHTVSQPVGLVGGAAGQRSGSALAGRVQRVTGCVASKQAGRRRGRAGEGGALGHRLGGGRRPAGPPNAPLPTPHPLCSPPQLWQSLRSC